MTDSNSGPASENRPYLGDPQIVGKLLQGIARETIQCRIAAKQGILSPEDAKAIEEKEASGAARALLGRDKKYAVDANWNVPGVIDGFIKNELNIQDKGAEPVLVAGLLKFVGDIHQRLDLLNNPSQNPKAENEIQDIIEKYRNVLLGLSFAATPITAPVPDLAPPAPAPAPQAPKPVVPPVPVVAAAPAPVASAPIVPKPQPAPAKPQPAPTPVVAAVPDAPQKKHSGGGLKWAALLILLLLIGGGAFFFMKPKSTPPAPVAVAPTPPPAPVAPKIVGAAPVLNSNGTIDLIEDSGKSLNTISLKNGKKIVHIYDTVRIDGKSSFLVATDESDDTYDVWLIDESGDGRQVVAKAWDAKLAGNGKYLAYTTLQHVLVVEEVDGKRVTTADGAHDFAWAPKSDLIVYLRAGNGQSLTHPSALELARLQLADLKTVTMTGGFYDDVRPMIQPDGTIFLVAGSATGLPAFWKVAAGGSEPQQITNVRLDESNDSWVPTPFSTAQWSEDGRWLIYDFKEGSVEQIWGLQFDEAGAFKRATKIADGLLPRWINGAKFVCLKNVEGNLQANVHTVPGS